MVGGKFAGSVVEEDEEGVETFRRAFLGEKGGREGRREGGREGGREP
jgi:hypothetical protein